MIQKAYEKSDQISSKSTQNPVRNENLIVAQTQSQVSLCPFRTFLDLDDGEFPDPFQLHQSPRHH